MDGSEEIEEQRVGSLLTCSQRSILLCRNKLTTSEDRNIGRISNRKLQAILDASPSFFTFAPLSRIKDYDGF